MLRTPGFLKLCMRAKDAGFVPSFVVGDVVGRGFADLGAELFEILPGEKILSLYTGKLAALSAEDRARFFAVPNVDVVVDRIERAGDWVTKILQLDSRDWRVELRSGMSFDGPSIEEAVLGAYIQISKVSNA